MHSIILLIICGLCLIITIACGMHSSVDKHTSNWLICSRILIFIMLITKIVDFLRLLPTFNWIDLVQVVALIALFVLIEAIFRRKLLTFGAPWMALILELTTIVVSVICIF